MRVATDVGGTFTDLVYYKLDADGEPGIVHTVKTDTTPPDFDTGVINAIARAGIDAADFEFFAHGSTVVINALLSRRGAKTALLTTKGFRDVLEIGRGNRPDLFNFYFSKPKPFIPRYLRKEVEERVNYKGEVLTEARLDSLDETIAFFRAEGVEAIAVCFLHAYRNPANENAVVTRIRELWPEVSVVASNQISREWREYERTSTTVLTAYIHPLANHYIQQLENRLHDIGSKDSPYIMQSNGGIETVKGASDNPITMIESGPASGVLGAKILGEMIGEPSVVALDVGGTTAKCSLIENGAAKISTQYKIEWTRINPGYPIKTPVIDIIEIGNGGGSIAWVDEGGRMHVGPQSAGADPGPAAYGRGGNLPTTTDAQLVTGRISTSDFAGGDIEPDMDNVERAFASIQEEIGGTLEEIAHGVIRIADANMVNALKLVSINRGYDPREFALVAYGGGGGMHAVALAEELKFRKVIIPVNASVFSAWGMLMTDLRRDYLRTQIIPLEEAALEDINDVYAEIIHQALEDFGADGFTEDRVHIERLADMRYLGQEHTVKVSFPSEGSPAELVAEARERFNNTHEREFTFSLPNDIQVVNLHIVAYGLVDKPGLPTAANRGHALQDAVIEQRRVDFDKHGIHETQVYDRALLDPGLEIPGPAIIQEDGATTVLPPSRSAVVDPMGNIHIVIEE